jgi:PAS domain S-box-containing protein
VRSNAAAPIIIAGNAIGFSCSTAPRRELHGRSRRTLAGVRPPAAIAIENARLYAAVQNYASELEQHVAERTAELERERAQLKAILDAMGEGVTGVIMDEAVPVRFVNRAFTDLTGYTIETWDEALFKTEEMGEAEYVTLRQRIEDHITRLGIWKGELKLRRADHLILDVGVTSTAVRGPFGQLIGSVTIIRDISQDKILQDQKARFIANASHELRTPLTNVKTRLYLIRRQPEKLEEHLRVMELVANRMKTLIEDMLDVSRFGQG